MGWFMKTFCMSYLAASFQVLKLRDALNFYGSVYYAGQVLVAILYVIGRILQPYILEKSKIKEGWYLTSCHYNFNKNISHC